MSPERNGVSDTSLLEIRDIVAGYGEVTVLHGVTITVAPEGIVAVIGPNGAGKSTLLKAVYGLCDRQEGQIVFRPSGRAIDLTPLPPHRITAAGMNYVPQRRNVFPNLTVMENLEMGSLLQRERRHEQLEHVFDLFPLLRERVGQTAGTLSGGQRQMLALGRALMTEPSLLILDEPSAGLAPSVIDEVMERLIAINRTGVALLVVEQNARRSLAMADWGYVLESGRNRFEGSGKELLSDPTVIDLYLGGSGPG